MCTRIHVYIFYTCVYFIRAYILYVRIFYTCVYFTLARVHVHNYT